MMMGDTRDTKPRCDCTVYRKHTRKLSVPANVPIPASSVLRAIQCRMWRAMMSASDRASKLKCSQCYPVLVSANRIVLHLYTVGFSPFVFTHFISHIARSDPTSYYLDFV